MTSRIRRLDLLENACHCFVDVDVDDNSNQTQEGVSFIEKTHIVKRMSPKEDISRSFKLPTLPTPTQRRANTLTVIIG